MARIHSDEINAAIYALARDGVNGAEIHRRLLSGDAGLAEPIAPDRIAKRTVQQKAQRYREELRQQGDPLQNLDERDAADSLQRELLRIANHELARLKDRSRKGTFNAHDAAKLRELSKIGTQVDRHFAVKRAKAKATGSQPAEKGTKPRPESVVDRIGQILDGPASARSLSLTIPESQSTVEFGRSGESEEGNGEARTISGSPALAKAAA